MFSTNNKIIERFNTNYLVLSSNLLERERERERERENSYSGKLKIESGKWREAVLSALCAIFHFQFSTFHLINYTTPVGKA